MGTWTLIQIVFDIFMACGIFVIVMRMNRAPKDDPRLSRGLQLLQSKIAVLEDLSDRTEAQVGQLTAILESKSREVQAKVQLAEQHVHEIRVSMDRSLEVAKIFQDKIPHKEIIERQNTIKYVQAARMAHQGASVDEIAKAVDLPKGEVEFIASVNRDRLMFDESELPEWANKSGDVATSAAPASETDSGITREQAEAAGVNFAQSTRMRAEIELAENQRLVENLSRLQSEMHSLDQQLSKEHSSRDFSAAFEVPRVETESLKKLGEEFRKAVREGEVADARQPFPPLEQLKHTVSEVLSAPISNPSAPSNIGGLNLGQAIETMMAPMSASSAGATVQDPALARAVAQSKVQAALRSTAKPVTPARNASPELEAAKAVARDVTPKPAAKGEVRKVVFPRIDGKDA